MNLNIEIFLILIFIVFFTIFGILVSLKSKLFMFFHVVPFLIILSMIDVFFPAVLWLSYGNVDIPPWLNPFTSKEIISGVLYYTIFYIIMIFMIILTSKNKITSLILSYDNTFVKLKRRLNFYILVTGFIFCAGLYIEIKSYGGLNQWIFYNFTVRFNPTAKEKDALDIFFQFIPWRSLFNALCFLAFFFRYKFNRPKLYGFIIPLFGALFALTTSFRGSIFAFFLGLLFMENLRIFIHNNLNEYHLYGKGKESIFKIKYLIISGLIVSSFFVYGTLRSAYVNFELKQNKTEISAVYKMLNQGSGLQGVSGIIRSYKKDVELLKGKTFIDMLLLPIPRSIYTSKPEWYGVADVTRGMGWPESTQPAVTMPGESYANFGNLGLLIAVLYGLFFGFILKFFKKKGGIYIVLYPTVLIPLIFTSNWMSFTGVMNMFFPAIFTIFLIYIINIRIYI
tara:strand:- start:2975 stop:4330 length:1356 start_codon:yes stop_codon:yes gene_type:complete